jgi:hypothetical protein
MSGFLRVALVEQVIQADLTLPRNLPNDSGVQVSPRLEVCRVEVEGIVIEGAIQIISALSLLTMVWVSHVLNPLKSTPPRLDGPRGSPVPLSVCSDGLLGGRLSLPRPYGEIDYWGVGIPPFG